MPQPDTDANIDPGTYSDWLAKGIVRNEFSQDMTMLEIWEVAFGFVRPSCVRYSTIYPNQSSAARNFRATNSKMWHLDVRNVLINILTCSLVFIAIQMSVIVIISIYRLIRNTCIHCGYPVSSLAVCPECGQPIRLLKKSR